MTISHYIIITVFIVFPLLVRTRSITLSYYIYPYARTYTYKISVFLLLTCPIYVYNARAAACREV